MIYKICYVFQSEVIKQFMIESNEIIEKHTKEVDRLKGLLKYSQMTMEDFRDAHPDLALDPINRPTIYPHTEDCQPGAEEKEEKDH